MISILQWFGLVALIVNVLATPAAAENTVATSLEWMACESQLILLGRIKSTTLSKGPHHVVYDDCVIAVDEVLKGTCPEGDLTFVDRRQTTQPSRWKSIDGRREVLFFLSKSTNHGPESHLDGRYVPTPIRGQGAAIIDLDEPRSELYARDFHQLTKKDDILTFTRQWAKSGVKHSLSIDVPPDAPLFQKLWRGSAVSLLVPADEANRRTPACDTGEKPMWAAISVSEPLVTSGRLKRVQVSFALANEGDAAIDPKVESWRLIVNGSEHPDSPLNFQNGPRDSRWRSLPSTGHILFTHSLGDWLQKPGTYTVAWRGDGFESAPITFRVLKQE